jgi:hypothetical protein
MKTTAKLEFIIQKLAHYGPEREWIDLNTYPTEEKALEEMQHPHGPPAIRGISVGKHTLRLIKRETTETELVRVLPQQTV